MALVDAPLKPQLATTAAQERFNLGIALKAFRHARHFLPRLFPARHVAGAIEAVPIGAEALPAFHEPIGAHSRIDAHAGFSGHTPDQPAAAPRRTIPPPGTAP